MWRPGQVIVRREVWHGRPCRAEAGRLETELAADGPWWGPAWADWAPDPGWPRPELPPGWELG